MAGRSFTPEFRELTALRLSAQRISTPAGDPASVVRHLLAVQAQDWFAGLWAVGLRSDPLATDADVDAAQSSGAIVRSWPMRGTLHFVPAEDIGWMVATTAPRMLQTAAGRHRELELDDAAFVRAEAITRARLTGRERADRAELLAAFVADGLRVDGQRGPHLLGWLAQHAVTVLCSRTEYALHDEWVRSPRQLSRSQAVTEFALRYFLSHGPATVRDLAWWASLTLTDARAGLAGARDQLDELVIDGVSYFHAPGLEPADPAVRLLPGFDEYVLGYTDRTAPLAGEPLERVVPGKNGMFLSTLVIDGAITGTWKRTIRTKRVDLAFDEWSPVPQKRRPAVRREVARYSRHLGREVEVV